MKTERFFAAFILLTLITILLIGYSIAFYSSASVRMQISAWINQMDPRVIVLHTDRRPQLVPLLTQNASSLTKSKSAIQPTSTSHLTQPQQAKSLSVPSSHDLEQEQITVESTQAPIFQVIEEPPPDGSLVVPSLGIDQPVVPIFVRNQVWDLENLGTQIGWLQTTGSHPNDNLAMVLIGHVTLPYPGGAGAFLNLSALKPGDLIGYRSGQETYIYEVKGQTIVKPDQVDYLYRPDGKILLLVTCDGYNALEWKYDLRLIVEAVLKSVEK